MQAALRAEGPVWVELCLCGTGKGRGIRHWSEISLFRGLWGQRMLNVLTTSPIGGARLDSRPLTQGLLLPYWFFKAKGIYLSDRSKAKEPQVTANRDGKKQRRPRQTALTGPVWIDHRGTQSEQGGTKVTSPPTKVKGPKQVSRRPRLCSKSKSSDRGSMAPRPYHYERQEEQAQKRRSGWGRVVHWPKWDKRKITVRFRSPGKKIRPQWGPEKPRNRFSRS